MKFTTISDDFFELIKFDNEVLHNKDEKRPYLIILKLKYKGKKQTFAVPFRSNISNYIPKDQYYSLPPRFSTKTQKIHGLHYIKMFPIHKMFLQKYTTDQDPYFQMVEQIVIKNKKDIINEAQAYLDKYQVGEIVSFSTSIDKIYTELDIYVQAKESEATKEAAATTP